MSVLMRGVDMPKNCEECNFKGECRDYWAKIRDAYTRPSWCPLVEVSDSEKPNNCETCGTPKHLCQYCIAEDRMWTPKTEPQTVLNDYSKADDCMECEKFFDCDAPDEVKHALRVTDCAWK